MAKATVGAAGIEYIQGALKRPKKENGHKHGNYLVMTHRSAASTNPNCQRIYSAVKARSKDLMQQATDITNFLAQKDTAGGKKTMKAYLWKVCGDAYDAALAGA